MNRAENHLHQLKEKTKKIALVMVRLTPIMEVLTGIMIAILIFYSGKLILRNEIDVNNFFSFLAAMMLAYQPVRTLASLNVIVNQGLSAANRILPIIDQQNKIRDDANNSNLIIKNGTIKFTVPDDAPGVLYYNCQFKSKVE